MAMNKTPVFGVGLNKTGTTSLKLAFQKLGYRHFDRRPRAFRLYKNKRWQALFDLIADFESFEDWPWPLMVPQLLDRFGSRAKFILTRRTSAEAWLDSLKSQSLKTHPVNNPRRDIFGFAFPHGAERQHIAFYERHLETTRHFFADKPGQMVELCWEEGDGWPELCAFLGHECPETPFPHANRSDRSQIDPERIAENQRLIEEQRRKLGLS